MHPEKGKQDGQYDQPHPGVFGLRQHSAQRQDLAGKINFGDEPEVARETGRGKPDGPDEEGPRDCLHRDPGQ